MYFYVAHKMLNFQQIHLDTLYHRRRSIDTSPLVWVAGRRLRRVVSDALYGGVLTPS